MDGQPRENNLQYTFRTVDDVVVVELTGDLDMYTNPVAKEMLQIIVSQNQRKVLFNLKNLVYCDSAGLGFLTGAFKTLQDRGGVLKICTLGAYVQRIFDLIHLEYFIEVYADEPQALESFKGTLDKAIEQWQKVTRLNPNYADAHHKLAIALREKARYPEAIAEEKTALQINPNYAEAYKGLGDLHRLTGELEEAAQAYRAALKINPHYAEAMALLGVVYQDKAMLQDAIDEFRKALQINPNYADIHNALGLALRNAGRTDEARAAFARACEINPHYVDARINLAEIYREAGDLDGFRREINQALTDTLDEGKRQKLRDKMAKAN